MTWLSWMFPIAALLASVATALVGGAPDPAAPMLVIAPPWADIAAIVEEAGGWIVGPTHAPLGALAMSGAADFAQEAQAAGAWIVTNGTALAQLCGVL